MKNLISIIMLHFILTATECQTSGWFMLNPSPTSELLNSVNIFDQNNAIAVGYYGTVIRTTNGGISWSNPLTTSAISGLEPLIYYDMRFFDQNTGLIIGNNTTQYNTKIFKTVNNGLTWSLFSDISAYGWARSMFFQNLNTGWVGTSVNVLKTTNAGATWQVGPTAFPSFVSSMLFLDSLVGYATSSSKIFKSVDGGLNWTLMNTSQRDYGGLFFFNTQTGWAVGNIPQNGSLIQKTTDGGVTWVTKLASNTTGILSSVYFMNSLTGVAVGGNYDSFSSIFRTSDGGETWNLIPNSCNKHLNAVHFLDPSLGMAVGYNGKVLRSSDAGLTWSVSPGFHTHLATFLTLSFVDQNTGWISSGNSASANIYKTTDGGSNWLMIKTPATKEIEYIQFLNSNIGYFLTGRLYKSINGGFYWQELPQFDFTVISLKFQDINTGWASGFKFPGTGKLVKTTNGGAIWETIPIPFGNCSTVPSFNFINDNTGWICVSYCLYPIGNYCKIYRTTNAGVNWTDQRTDTGRSFKVFSFANNTTGWAASNDLIVRTTNAGDTWSPQTIGLTGFSVSGMQFINSSIGWLSVQSNCAGIFKTTNGGNNWYPQVDAGLGYLDGMQFINELTGWAVGYEGVVIKTTNGGEIVSVNNFQTSVPKITYLDQNYPNPFNPITKIRFEIPSPDIVIVKIFDVLGHEIATLVNEKLQPGTYEVDWNAAEYPSGVYFYQIFTENYIEARKMILIK